MTALDINVCVHFGNEEIVRSLLAELKELPAIFRRNVFL
jgi:hypothetical protein